MPISDVTTGHGSQLWIDTGTGLARVAEIDDIPELPTGSERGLYETSNFDTVGFKEFKKEPLKEGVEVTITGNYVINSAADSILQAADDAEGALPFRIVLKEGALTYYCEGDALFYNLKRMNPKAEKRTFSIALKPVSTASIDPAA